jgi:hypothetical protein
MARCGAITQDGTKCRNRVADGRTWCYQHPGGRSASAQPSRRPRRTATVSRTRPRRPRRSSRSRRTQRALRKNRAAAERRTARIRSRASKSARVVDETWSHRVLDQLDAIVGPGTAQNLSVNDCAALAGVAGDLLHGRHSRYRRGFRRILFGPSVVDTITAALLNSLVGAEAAGPIATARSLQAVGIAICRRDRVPLTACPCYSSPAGDEFERTLMQLLRLAVGDWSDLVIPFEPLGSP